MRQLKGQMKLDLDLWFGRMSPEPFQATAGKTSEKCSKRSSGSQTSEPLYLDLRAGSGLLRERSWERGSPSLGVYWTRSFGACPSVAVESRLSQILEAEAPRKYYLSAKACRGVLRRARERGKELPPLLKAVLERQAGLTICKEAERVGSVTKKNAAKRCVREVPARRYVIRSTERHTIKGKMRSICRGSAMTGSEKRL